MVLWPQPTTSMLPALSYSALAGVAWRAVEHQYTISTRKIVDSDAEQELLENLLENESKPPIPPEAKGLDYLLFTPFRYTPGPRHGSRFRRSGPGPGVFYAAERIRTALAEIAYYRYRFFLVAQHATLPKRALALTVFSVPYKTLKCLDLFYELRSRRMDWMNPDDYSETQALAYSARAAGIEVIRYESVRDPEHAANLALLTPSVFSRKQPQETQTWILFLSEREASFRRPHSPGNEKIAFAREALGLPR